MSMASSIVNTISVLSFAGKSSRSSWLPCPQLASQNPLSFTGRRRLIIRATEKDENEIKSKAPAASGSSFNQILGIKGAKQETEIWKVRVQLTKPVTWPPLIWGVVCGAAASGNFHWNLEDIAKAVVCMLMSGPCLTGYTQTLNDWYDREIDAINEPYRPIPSGAISENEVITQIRVLLLGGLGLAGLLDVWAGHGFLVILYLAVGGALVSYIYSTSPLKKEGASGLAPHMQAHIDETLEEINPCCVLELLAFSINYSHSPSSFLCFLSSVPNSSPIELNSRRLLATNF